MMKASTIVSCILLATGCIGLTACSGVRWRVYVDCDVRNGSKSCRVGGEGSGSIRLNLANRSTMQKFLANVASIGSAADFSIDVSGSTIAYPTSGQVTVTLSVSSTGAVEAVGVFPWIRTGSVIRLSDPGSVDAWAISNSGDADSMAYDLVPFEANFADGSNTIAATSYFQGAATASSASEFTYCNNDPGHPSEDACMSQ